MQSPLPAPELKRRIDAARTLRGFTQAELAKLLADDGHPAYHVGEVERGKMTLSGTLRRSLAHHLNVPEEWFTADDVLDLSAGPGDRLAQLETRLANIERQLDLMLKAAGIIPGRSVDVQLPEGPFDRRQHDEDQRQTS